MSAVLATTEDHWNAAAYGRDVRFVSDLGAPLVALLAPAPGMRVLDLGCGDGALTRAIAETGAEVTGVDASADMVAAARALGIEAHVVDGHGLGGWAASQAPFDAVFSNAALHWMRDPAAVFRGVAAALRPGGRLVAEQGGHGNVAAICTALSAAMAEVGAAWSTRDLWSFPTPAEQQARLEAAGFAVERIALIPRPTPVPAGMRAWLNIFAPGIVAGLAPATREAVLDRAAALLAPALRDEAGAWTADYMRLRFVAMKTGPSAEAAA